MMIDIKCIVVGLFLNFILVVIGEFFYQYGVLDVIDYEVEVFQLLLMIEGVIY